MKDEAALQASFCQWMKLQYPSVLFFSIPNGAILGGKSRWAQMNCLKKTGLLVGCPDLFIAEPSGYWHGCFMETKSTVGKLTQSQEDIMLWLQRNGYKVEVYRSLEEGMKIVNDYFNKTK